MKFLHLDVETTGLEPETDEITELGCALFDTTAHTFLGAYGGLRDPQQKIPALIQEMTGITPEMVAGRTLNDGLIREMATEADYIVAHRAKFDMGFVYRYFVRQAEGEERVAMRSLFGPNNWLCSLFLVDWDKILKDNTSKRQKYLSVDKQIPIMPYAHRALFDALMNTKLCEEHYQEMIDKATADWIRLSVDGVPYQEKDKVKQLGYRWSPPYKVWYKDVPELEGIVEQELETLHQSLTSGNLFHPDVRRQRYSRWYELPDEFHA